MARAKRAPRKKSLSMKARTTKSPRKSTGTKTLPGTATGRKTTPGKSGKSTNGNTVPKTTRKKHRYNPGSKYYNSNSILVVFW